MTIRSATTAIIAVFSVVLILAPTANAEEKKSTKKDEKPAPILVEIQPGDTLSAIADTHGTTYVRIFNANEFITNPDVINPGDKVRIPTADEQLPERLSEQQVVAAAPVVATPPSSAAKSAGATQKVVSSSVKLPFFRTPSSNVFVDCGDAWRSHLAAS